MYDNQRSQNLPKPGGSSRNLGLVKSAVRFRQALKLKEISVGDISSSLKNWRISFPPLGAPAIEKLAQLVGQKLCQ